MCLYLSVSEINKEFWSSVELFPFLLSFLAGLCFIASAVTITASEASFEEI